MQRFKEGPSNADRGVLGLHLSHLLGLRSRSISVSGRTEETRIIKNLSEVNITGRSDTVMAKDTTYRGADKFLARSGRKQATASEDVDFHISYL